MWCYPHKGPILETILKIPNADNTIYNKIVRILKFIKLFFRTTNANPIKFKEIIIIKQFYLHKIIPQRTVFR